MIDLFVLLTPIFLLGVIALLGFVGCDRLFGLTPVPPPSQQPHPPTLRDISTNTATPGTSVTINDPLGVGSDDVLLAVINMDGGDIDMNVVPMGWAPLDNHSIAIPFMRQRLFYRVGGGGGPYTFTVTPSANIIGAIVAYIGCDKNEPINYHDGQVNTASTTITAPALRPTVANTMLVAFFGAEVFVPGPAPGNIITPQASMTPRGQTLGAGNVTWGLRIAEEVQVSSGDTGTRTATVTGPDPARPNIGQIVALKGLART